MHYKNNHIYKTIFNRYIYKGKNFVVKQTLTQGKGSFTYTIFNNGIVYLIIK